MNIQPGGELDHESALISTALVGGPDTARELTRTVEAHMFEDSDLRATWSALGRVLTAATGPVDLIDATAAELAGDAHGLGRIDLHEMSTAVPSAANAAYYAGRVRAAYARRELESIAPPELLERGADLATADLATGIAERARQLVELAGGARGSVLVEAADFEGQPQPAPVLWHDNPAAPDLQQADAVLSVGEVALLSGAGGLGKSTLVLELVSAAVAGADLGQRFGRACGIRVAAGPVVLVSYEDAPTRIAHRLTWMNNGTVPHGVHLWPDPAPLWYGDGAGASAPGASWLDLWRSVREVGARLVVIDPVSAALVDVSMSETGPVRAFLRELAREAERARAGVLLLSHDTKAARDAARRDEEPGAGAVAGSAAWFDGARGVLTLTRKGEVGGRVLKCAKANYGRTGWTANLRERTGPGGAFRGLELDPSPKGAQRATGIEITPMTYE